MRIRKSWTTPGLIAVCAAIASCGPSDSSGGVEPGGTGGIATGGGGTGGVTTGGVTTGGVTTGGVTTGGVTTGGVTTGGVTTGGVTTGGVTTGGVTTGGVTTGGIATGGVPTGGVATGGQSTGGTTGGANTGGEASGGVTGCGAGTSVGGDVVVELGTPRQRIAGFGASTAWGSTMSTEDADLLWSTSTGAGLSLHRIRIAPDGTTSETSIAQLAVARGATIWASPWSPAAAYKSNNNTVGGTLTNGQAWANSLANFVTSMQAAGVNIYAVSAQNEPDAEVTYDSCSYTGDTLADFIGAYMGPALASTGARVMAPESQNWCGLTGLADPIMNDATAASYTSIIATHEYGCRDAAHKVPYSAGIQAGKEFWQTEMYDTGSTIADPGMGSALRVNQMIHESLTIANMNAWHFWWVYPSVNDNGALWDQGSNSPSKRLWVMGNYSRFVRPGSHRVATSGDPPSGVLLSAYDNPADGTVVVVAANTNANAVSLSVFIDGVAPCNVTPWVTSSSDSLASKSGVSVSDSRFTFSLEGQSVTTFVGTL